MRPPAHRRGISARNVVPTCSTEVNVILPPMRSIRILTMTRPAAIWAVSCHAQPLQPRRLNLQQAAPRHTRVRALRTQPPCAVGRVCLPRPPTRTAGRAVMPNAVAAGLGDPLGRASGEAHPGRCPRSWPQRGWAPADRIGSQTVRSGGMGQHAQRTRRLAVAAVARAAGGYCSAPADCEMAHSSATRCVHARTRMCRMAWAWQMCPARRHQKAYQKPAGSLKLSDMPEEAGGERRKGEKNLAERLEQQTLLVGGDAASAVCHTEFHPLLQRAGLRV